jgi:hypothetical protein
MPLNLYSKESIDTLLADKLDLAGGTMTGALTLSASGIIFSDATYLTTAPAGSALAADQLTAGVVATNPSTGPTTAGDVLQYNGTDLVWAAGGGGLTISTLSNGATSTLNATAPTAGQVLSYDGTDLIWASGGGGGGVAWGAITGTVTDQTDLTTYLGSNYYPLSGNPSGFLTSVPGPSVNNQNGGGSYTITSSDAGNIIYCSGSSLTINVPDDSSIPTGARITICVDNTSNFQVIGSGSMSTVTINGTTSAISLNEYVMQLVKVATDTWYIA